MKTSDFLHAILVISFIFVHASLEASPQIKLKDGKDPSIIQIGKPYIKQIKKLNDTIIDFSRMPSRDTYNQIVINNPNFIAEAVLVLPIQVETEQKEIDYIITLLSDIVSFDTIPYYSNQNKTWNPLFENTIIKQVHRTEDESLIFASQMMRPFEQTEMSYAIHIQEKGVVFISKNNQPLKFNGVTVVDPGKMITNLFVESQPGYILLYGIGCARTFNFFGLFGNRLNAAFIGRIEAFYQWFFDKIISRSPE